MITVEHWSPGAAGRCPHCAHPLRKDTETYYWCPECKKLWELISSNTQADR